MIKLFRLFRSNKEMFGRVHDAVERYVSTFSNKTILLDIDWTICCINFLCIHWLKCLFSYLASKAPAPSSVWTNFHNFIDNIHHSNYILWEIIDFFIFGVPCSGRWRWIVCILYWRTSFIKTSDDFYNFFL